MASKHEILRDIYEFAEENIRGVGSSIPVSYPDLRPEDVAAMGDALLSFWYTEHKFCRNFAASLAETMNKKHCLLVNSGSSANLVAVLATFDPNKKFVITCAVGFPTTVAPIYQAGFQPIYVDIDPITLEPSYAQIKSILNHNRSDIAGLIIAHTLGFVYDESIIRDMLGDIPFIADSCDALGGLVGNYADVVTLSFFPAHQIMAIEGGAILTDDDEIYEKARSISNWGRSCRCLPGQSNVCGTRFSYPDNGGMPDGWDHKYLYSDLGYNLKMTEFQAACGFSQLQRLNGFVEARRENFLYLKDLIDGIQYPIYTVECCLENCSPFGFPIIYETDARDLINYLESFKISTRPVFAGNITRQPGFMDLPYATGGDLSDADFVTENIFWVGVGPFLTSEMLDYMGETLYNYFGD